MARFEYVNDTVQELYVQTYTVGKNEVEELKVLRQTTPPQVNDAGGIEWDIDEVALRFDSLVGTVPPMGVFLCGTEKIQYASITWLGVGAGTFRGCKRGWENTTAATHANNQEIYFADAFAYVNDPTTILANEETIAFDGLDRPGQLPETGVIYIGTEWIWYGGVAYTNVNKTAGNLLYCGRGYNNTTPAIHADNALIRFEHNFTHRENVALYNYAGGSDSVPIYYGYNPTIQNNGINGLALEFGDNVTIPLGPRIRIYAILDQNEMTPGTVAIAEWR